MNIATPISNAAAAEEIGRYRTLSDDRPDGEGINSSAVSWGAILAGAAAAAALSLILLILGTGLGFSVVSPWSQKGIGAGGLGTAAIVWLTVTQVFASGLGGYLAGRLRTRWIAVHVDEVYFRDTAHGFLAWAIASLATATLLTSLIGSMVDGGIHAGATVLRGATTAGATVVNSELAKPDADGTRTAYFMDSLFRTGPGNLPGAVTRNTNSDAEGASQPGNAQQLVEVTGIFMNTLRTGPLPAEDVRYTAQLVAQRTGLSQQEAEVRVNDTYGRMQARFNTALSAAFDAADRARKASTYAALWLFVSLLAGAFVASWTALYGGRQRDM